MKKEQLIDEKIKQRTAELRKDETYNLGYADGYKAGVIAGKDNTAHPPLSEGKGGATREPSSVPQR